MTPLVLALLGLLLLDVAGAAWAVSSGVNSAAEAFSSSAKMAAPWPMILFQVLMTVAAWRAAKKWAMTALVLLAVACLISAISGFFDGGLSAAGLSRSQVTLQYVLVSWTAVVGVFALARCRA